MDSDEEEATGEHTFMVEWVAEREWEVSERDGVLEFLVDGEWRRVPNELWAWTPCRTTYRRCEKCSFHDDCQHEFYSSDIVRHLI